MGRLRHRDTDQHWPLLPSTTVGRAADAWISLSAPTVSTAHAHIGWRADRWRLKDLESTNGTAVDGRGLGLVSEALEVGQALRFGGPDGEVLEVVDVGPPEPLGRPVDEPEAWRSGEDGVLLLGDEEHGILVSQGRSQWTAGEAPVADGEVVSVGGQRWLLRLPDVEAATVKVRPDQSAMRLLIKPSADLEDFELVLRPTLGPRRSLGHRVYGYMLFVLARARRDDLDAGVEAAEVGWMEVAPLLAEMERAAGRDLFRRTLDQYVLRFKQLMARNGWPDGPRIERRSGSDRVRVVGPVELPG